MHSNPLFFFYKHKFCQVMGAAPTLELTPGILKSKISTKTLKNMVFCRISTKEQSKVFICPICLIYILLFVLLVSSLISLFISFILSFSDKLTSFTRQNAWLGKNIWHKLQPNIPNPYRSKLSNQRMKNPNRFHCRLYINTQSYVWWKRSFVYYLLSVNFYIDIKESPIQPTSRTTHQAPYM